MVNTSDANIATPVTEAPMQNGGNALFASGYGHVGESQNAELRLNSTGSADLPPVCIDNQNSQASEPVKQPSASQQPGAAPGSNKSLLGREAELFGSLKDNLWNSVSGYVHHDKLHIALETGAALAVGAGMAALTRNPALLGDALAPAVKAAVPFATKVGFGLGALDWGMKIGNPAFDTWKNPNHLSADKQMLANNVGSGLVDYSAMGLGGLAGGRLGWRLAPEYSPKAPAFDLHPSQKINETPRMPEHPEQFETARESRINPDVVNLYENSFPEAERQPTEEVGELVQNGRILVHTTRDNTGKLGAFSFVSLHDEGPTKFAGLDYVATEEANRSSGLGSLHLQRLNDSVKVENPDFIGMTLEMEHPGEPDLSPEEQDVRDRRSRFYDRLDAPNTNIKYNILDFEDPSYRGMAQHRAFVYQPDKFNAPRAAYTFMTDEGGYQLKPNDPAVLEFNKANNYWEWNPSTNWAVGATSPAFLSVLNQGSKKPNS